MAAELQERTFMLFANNMKTGDRQPDFTGSVKLDGVLYRLAGWQKQARNGDPFVSGKLERLEE